MTPLPPAKTHFQKTEVPCLYRYSSNGVYYALVKHEGKQKRASLKTTDKTVAKRKLADFQRGYLATVQNQAATVSLKKGVIERLLADLPLAQMYRPTE